MLAPLPKMLAMALCTFPGAFSAGWGQHGCVRSGAGEVWTPAPAVPLQDGLRAAWGGTTESRNHPWAMHFLSHFYMFGMAVRLLWFDQ